MPYYGIRRMTAELQARGYAVNHKRTARLLRWMGLCALYPKPFLSKSVAGNKIYPYLLKDLQIERPNQVWSTDITYIRLRHGFVYLVAVMDWYSRYVLSWELSTTMETAFCISALEWALRQGRPEIFNSDQGSQFTSREFTGKLEEHEIRISMDGRGRAYDNIFIERLWRTVKYEDVYLKNYESVPEALAGLSEYFTLYNNRRRHQALGYRTPREVYFN
jgi:putative transposase